VRLNGKMKLIDLDAAGMANEDFACTKFSSGFLPPEAIHKFRDQNEMDGYNAYWKHEKDNNTERWKILKPRMYGGKWFVVKTFMEGDSMENIDQLPYKRLKLTKSFDSWSVGALFYELICGTSLPGLKSDQNDNLVDGQSYHNLLKWNKDSVHNVYADLEEKISDPGPIQEILSKILVQITKDRPQRISMKGIIDNPFNPDVKTTPVTKLYSSIVLICVQLLLEDGKYSTLNEIGTGFVVDEALGLVVTSRHVIAKKGRIFVYYPHNITNSMVTTSAANPQANSEREVGGHSSQYGASVDAMPNVYEATHCHEAILIPYIGNDDHTVLDACILKICDYKIFDPVPQMNLCERFEPGETVRILGYRQEALRNHVNGCVNYVLDFSKGTYVTRYDLPQEKDRVYKGAEITVDCNSFRGYSGGPAVNKKGEVIGIVRGFYYDDQPEFDYGLCTLVPSSDVLSLIQKARECFLPCDY